MKITIFSTFIINMLQQMATESVQSLPIMKVATSQDESEISTLSVPAPMQGGLLKKRRFPSKGWIKRYFSLADGILKYAVNYAHSTKLKYHGIFDLGRTTIVFYSQARRFDIDSDSGVCHIKCKLGKEYEEWSLALRKHRMYRVGSVWGHEESLDEMQKKGLRARSSSVQNNALANWIVNTDYFVKDFKTTLNEAKSQLSSITKSDSFSALPFESTSTPLANESKLLKENTRSRKISKGSKNRRSISPSRILPVITNMDALYTDKDKNALRNSVPEFNKRASFEGISLAPSFASDTTLNINHTPRADSVCNKLYELVQMLERQQEELKVVLQQETEKYTQQRVVITNLKLSLNEALTQNTKYREKLNRIKGIVNSDSETQYFEDYCDNDSHTLPIIQETQEWSSSEEHPRYENQDKTPSPLELSRHPSVISSSIFFDAYEDNNSSIPYYDADHGQESSDSVDEFVGDSDNENSDSEFLQTQTVDDAYTKVNVAGDVVLSKGGVKKRDTLPAPRPDIGGLSLWSILRKNIGKDLSRISMPVALNEPLSALQRLSEELEYTELIDKACECEDPHDRMLYIAAFALSPYSTSYYRAGQKVFNPVLGETYELIDEEKNFKFLAEQVSHHPPVSACHAESSNFMFWEDARLKYKFWGQSMELYPTGTVQLLLSEKSEYYTWAKVTTCVHNVLNFQSRWIENYGEMLITCSRTGITCNISLSKSSYFSNKKYDIKGDVISGDGEKVRHLFGMMKEGIYSGAENGEHTCLWRPNLMPLNYETFYGFSSFAMELNHLPNELKEWLPISDSRFRSDQRLLEEGHLAQAEEEKKRIEQIQRDVRAKREEEGEEWKPIFFEKNDNNESWIYKQNYFSARETKFVDIDIPKLW